MTVYSDALTSATGLTLSTTPASGSVVDLEAVYDGLLMITSNSAGSGGTPTGTWGWRGSVDNVHWYPLGAVDGWSGDFYAFGSTFFLHCGLPARYVYVTGVASAGAPVLDLAQVIRPV